MFLRTEEGHQALPEEVSDPINHGGFEISVAQSSEPLNGYYVVSKIKVKLKLVLNKVWRLKDRYDSMGDPVYVANFTILNSLDIS
jgi:hypothetical protein